MKEDRYKNREIDDKFESIHKRLDVQDGALEKILAQTTATNGKVRKLTLTIVAIIAYIVGISGQAIIPILTKFI